jgi:diguanylate cyclase (GGDEF)-like protein/PAS domain S-box-containing protein
MAAIEDADPPEPLFARLCDRLAREAAVARAAIALPDGAIVWSGSGPMPGAWTEAAANPDGPCLDPTSGWAFDAPLPGGAGRVLLFDPEPRTLAPEAQAALADTAEIVAARLAANARATPPAIKALARFGHFRLDRATGTVEWSPEIYRLYGYDPAAGAPSLAMALAAFPEAAQSELRRGIARSWDSGAEVSVAAALTRRDGSRRDVLVRLRADPAPEGAPRSTLWGIMLDVTEARAFDERLERERDLLQTTLDHMDQGLIVVEPDMSVPVLSRRVTEMLHLPEAFIEAPPSFPEILNYQYESGTITLEVLNSSINAFILELQDLPQAHVYERETFDGKVVEVRTTKLPSGGFVRTFTDQTARRERDAEIARAEAEYRLLFENSVNGIYRALPDGRPIRANPALVRLHGYDSEAELLAAMAGPVDAIYVEAGRQAEFRRLLDTEGRVTDFVSEIVRHRTGERVWVSEAAWVIRDETGAMVAYEGTVVDATERKRAEASIAHMALHDGLTGLPNRQRFAERLATALEARGRDPLALLFFDLDHFKTVNDTFGHPAGDALLQALAARLARLAAPGHVLARFGGDEFALLAPGAGEAEAAALARRILETMTAPLTVDGREIAVRASIGIALAPRDGADPIRLMKSADMALYRAKGAGRETFRFFAPAMDAALRRRQRLQEDLRGALDRCEFALVYQPVVALDTGTPVGFEALLRWNHPERGAVAPEEFIAAAEESRLIGPIGDWVLRRACRDAARWPGTPALWANVSTVQLARQAFEHELSSALNDSGLDPKRLVLEITETALMDGRGAVGPRLERLRARSIRTALDDFGTGYSSLGYLRLYGFDVLKIDRSFVQALDEPDTAAIVASVLDLAARLGMETVAEGVETEAQRDALAAAGCRLAQGHLFGTALAAEAVGH